MAQSFTPGTYRLRVTANGNRDDIRLDVPAVTLVGQQTQLVVLTPTLGVGLVDGATVVEKGAYAAYPNMNARVRVVSGIAGSLITASAGTTVVEAGAVSPAIGQYRTVPAGAASWVIKSGSNTVATPPINLAAGSDSTVLITGASAAATAVLLADDNHPATLITNTNLRLVNGLAGSSAGLSMSVDFSLVASNVSPGTTSGYRPVPGNTNMRLEVATPLSVTPISLQNGLNIPGGSVYSIFVLGDSATPVTTIRKDR